MLLPNTKVYTVFFSRNCSDEILSGSVVVTGDLSGPDFTRKIIELTKNKYGEDIVFADYLGEKIT